VTPGPVDAATFGCDKVGLRDDTEVATDGEPTMSHIEVNPEDRLSWNEARHLAVDPLPADAEPDADDAEA